MNIRAILFCLLLLAFFYCRTHSVQAQADVPAAADGSACVLICGDSVMKMLGMALERELAARPGVRVQTFTSIGSGLARLDLFDWPEQAASLIERERPDVVVVLIGSNDNQPMQTTAGMRLGDGTREWTDEYARRVGAFMDVLVAGNVKQALWLGLPDMREPNLQRHIEEANRIARAQIQARSRIAYFDTQRLLSREPGKFSSYVLGKNGMPIHVRAQDGIHLQRAGAEMLAREIVVWLETQGILNKPAAGK